MQEKPRVVVSRTRRVDTAPKEFNFTEADIRAGNDSVAAYRTLAWNAFQRLTLPVNTEEAWRRTDLHALPVEKFKLGTDGVKDFPPVREDLLKPLVANQHGGQIILTPSGAKIELDEKLTQKGVVFTDLVTAEQ